MRVMAPWQSTTYLYSKAYISLRMSVPTKIDFSFNRIARLQDLNDLAQMLFPGNRNHQRAFLAIFVEVKWYAKGPLPDLAFVCKNHGVSPRTLERVRAKMRRLGIIDHVSRFSKKWGYREGWVLSTRFERSLQRLAEQFWLLRERGEDRQERRDKDALNYV